MSRLTDIPHGPLCALTEAIEKITIPTPEILLKGSMKVILVGWFGPLDDLESSDLDRGDGFFQILRENEPGYQQIPGVFDRPSALYAREPNIRMGVPFWLLHSTSPQALMAGKAATTLATGHIHPLYNSATVDVYCPSSGEHQCRRYVMDFRTPPDQAADPALSVSQQEHLRLLGGQPTKAPQKAPSYAPLCLA